jgi:hypothetical protein
MFDESQLVLVETPASRSCHVNVAFVTLARVLTGVLVTLAPFRIFEFIVGNRRMWTGIDLIQAQLRIGFWRTDLPLLDCTRPETLARKKRWIENIVGCRVNFF